MTGGASESPTNDTNLNGSQTALKRPDTLRLSSPVIRYSG